MADTPVSVTAGPNGQKIETNQQWNVQDWFDTKTWSLTGTQADSDFKAGMWWQQSQDFNNIVAPTMRTAADQWDALYAKLDTSKANLTAARAKLVGYTGKDAASLNQTLDNLTQSLEHQAQAAEPAPKALRSGASIIETSHTGPMTRLWNKWQQDLANAPACKADVEQMQPVISGMPQAVLDAANAVQKAYHTEISPPEISTPQPGATQTVGDNSSTGDGSADSSSTAAQSTATPTPGVVAAGTSNATANTTSATAVGTAPGTVVTPTSTGTLAAGATGPSAASAVTGTGAVTGPTLAGLGASTAAPTVPTAPAFAPGSIASGGGAATLPPVLPAAGFAGTATGAVGGSALAPGAGFVPFGTGAGTGRETRHDEDDRKRQGLISPIGGAGAARGTRSARIRPGDAARPSNRAGVAAGLLGRAAKDAESADVVASTQRKTTKAAARRSPDGQDGQDMFLDEDAWLIDDPGVGVVEAHQPHDPGAASAVVG